MLTPTQRSQNSMNRTQSGVNKILWIYTNMLQSYVNAANITSSCGADGE